MYIQEQELEYRRYLSDNSEFWREYGRRPVAEGRERWLCLDICHDHPAYLLTNLWIAKYIQQRTGARILALAHGWRKPCPHYSYAHARELAESFLADEVIDLDSGAEDGGEALSRLERAVEGLSGRPLRQAVLAFDRDRDPDLGWVLYDTWLRQELRGTLETAEDSFFDCARSVLRVREAISRALRGRDIAGAVVGHYHYSPYSFLALEAARREAPVYFQSLLVPVTIRRFANLADLRRGRASDFAAAYEKHARSRVQPRQLDRFTSRVFQIQTGTREFFRPAPATEAVGRDELLRSLGLAPERPAVCIMAPALCAAPHSYGPLAFDDYGDWLDKSLETATLLRDVNFLVKRHPQDKVYETTNLIERLEAKHKGAANIRFLDASVSPAMAAESCDVGVTVNGTPGYEMAVRGLPTIAAGPARYSGLGFTLEPSSLMEYEALLARASEHRLTAEQRREAALFAYFELGLGRSRSLFLPPLRLTGTAEFWNEAGRSLRSAYVEEDPLYRNLRFMLTENLPFLLNTDLADADGV